MEKYRYNYEKVFSDGKTFEFASGLMQARIDFLDYNLYRVALYKASERLIPTWGVAPGDTRMEPHGRDRLSLDGFPMFAPSMQNDSSFSSDGMGNSQKLIFSLPDADVVLYLPRFFMEVYTKSGELLISDRTYSPYNYNGELGKGSAHFLKAQRYEEIFGLGEKSGDVNKFGRSFTIGARDSMGYDASSTDPLYKHLPYYICRNSVGTYGLYYDTHCRSSLNFMEEMDNYYGHFKSFKSDDNALVYYVFLGDIKTISTKFAWLVGRSVFSPRWSLNYCGSTMSYTDAPNANEQLLGFLNNCQDKNLKVSGFYLSSGYTSIGDRRYVFNWNTDKIPDPKKLIATYNDAGVHFIPNIKPAFLEDHPYYEFLSEKGYFLHYSDGTPAKLPFWDGYGSYLDFTNPEAFKWWTSMVKEKLIDYGIDALWNDNNEYYIADEDIWANGFGEQIQAYKICQVFTGLMVMASNEALPKDGQRYFMSTRSGGAGINRLAQTWTGDNYSSFKDLFYNHKMAMGMSISAMPLLGHDLGGFSGNKPEPELFMRWLQYGVFLPRFTIHSWNDDGSVTEPWMYPELLSSVQNLFAFRNRIKPALYDLLYKVHKNYDTFLTPLFVDYPNEDPESGCFLLGHDLLCAPVFFEGTNNVEVTLPGNLGWYLDSYNTLFAPGSYELECQITDTPILFHKAGSVFLEDVSEYSNSPSEENLRIVIYPLEKGCFTSTLFVDQGEFTINVNCDAKTYSIKKSWDSKNFNPEIIYIQ